MQRLLILLLLAVSLLAQTAQQRVYIVTHVDLMPPTAEDGRKLITQFIAEAMKDSGAVRYEALVEPGRLNHVTLVSVWASREQFEKHLALPHTRQFREKLQPLLGGPLDERLHVQFP